MQWYNEPPSWEQSDGRLIVDTSGETDFWRTTKHGFIADDGHFFHRGVSGDFTATIEVTGDYETRYDQAGLMVRDDESVWMKCGIEYVDDVQQAGAVITRDVSDWSLLPLEDDPESVRIRVERIGATIEVYISRVGDEFTMIRQGYLSDSESLQVGPMAAAPQGEGFRTVFEGFTIDA